MKEDLFNQQHLLGQEILKKASDNNFPVADMNKLICKYEQVRGRYEKEKLLTNEPNTTPQPSATK